MKNLNTIGEICKPRTRSDVPYGLYFSGGIDSSLISTFHKFKYKFYFDSKKTIKKNFTMILKKLPGI